MAFTVKQRGVLGGISAAAAIAALGVLGAIFLAPEILTPLDDPASRLAFVLSWDLLVVVWLAIAIASVARRRFFSAEDIDGSGLSPGTEQVKILQAILQNTLEQVALALAVHIACAVLLPVEWMAAVAVAATLFAVGRLLFRRGYHLGAAGRALGFGLTFYPTILLFAVLVVRLFSSY